METDISNIYVYRMTHIDNLDYIFQSMKLCCPNHSENIHAYKLIGDKDLINYRCTSNIPIDTEHTLRDYVSFYFCNRSPMLYKIQKGNQINQVLAENIIYFVTTVKRIKDTGLKYIFTDSHASSSITKFYKNDEDFDRLDWKNTDSNPNKKSIKQAEFLVFLEVPLSSCLGIAVFNNKILGIVQQQLNNTLIILTVKAKPNYYY